ncbi:cobalt-zinc-cadmium resistance protein [Striga asiatica]|uniref:Cobalt-zinc-cadmium resistance protein n=1 Tax=Striga asiatica TaxID=4170 RepID=A0A5A7RJM5_STRAF|nr:cobalt-zinc-cadmium resistance protein [Striga asiatica]
MGTRELLSIGEGNGSQDEESQVLPCVAGVSLKACITIVNITNLGLAGKRHEEWLDLQKNVKRDSLNLSPYLLGRYAVNLLVVRDLHHLLLDIPDRADGVIDAGGADPPQCGPVTLSTPRTRELAVPVVVQHGGGRRNRRSAGRGGGGKQTGRRHSLSGTKMSLGIVVICSSKFQVVTPA